MRSERQSAHLVDDAPARDAARRSTSNRNQRGGSADRRRRRQWLVVTFRANEDADPSFVVPGISGVPYGTGIPACRCYRCGRLLTVATVSPDRIKPACEGGTYRRDNIRPACDLCQMQTGGALGASRRKS